MLVNSTPAALDGCASSSSRNTADSPLRPATKTRCPADKAEIRRAACMRTTRLRASRAQGCPEGVGAVAVGLGVAGTQPNRLHANLGLLHDHRTARDPPLPVSPLQPVHVATGKLHHQLLARGQLLLAKPEPDRLACLRS